MSRFQIRQQVIPLVLDALKWCGFRNIFTILVRQHLVVGVLSLCGLGCSSAVIAAEPTPIDDGRRNAETWLKLDSDRAAYKKTYPASPGQATRLQELNLQQQGLRDTQSLHRQQGSSLIRQQKSRVGIQSPGMSRPLYKLKTERNGNALRLQNQIQRQSWPRK